MSKVKMIPDLRFEGFDGEWENRKFKEIVNRVTKMSDSHNLPTIEYEDIISGEGRLNKEVPKNRKGRKGVYFEPNYILYGKLRPYLNNWLFTRFTGIALGDFWAFTTLNTAPLFDFYLIQSNKYQEVANLSSGTKMPRSDWKIVSNTSFAIPKTQKEQEAIGQLFKPLDDTIALSQQELTKLQNFKQAMLQKMFPREGERVPEIRFEGFHGVWEETTLGDNGFTYTGLSGKTKEDFGHGEARYVPYVNVFNHSITEIKDLEQVEIDNQQNQVRYGDILITTSSETPEDVGMSSVWKHDLQNVYLNSFCFGYRLKKTFDLNFIAHLLRSPAIRKQFTLLAQGISRFNISKTKAMDIVLVIPSVVEQRKIGKYFYNLDKNIHAKQAELKKLKQFKKAMLNKMFV